MSTEQRAFEKQGQTYTEVWGDTVSLKELALSAALGVALTMGFYVAGRSVFLGMPSIDPGLAKGYSLLVGIVGCLLAGVLSAKFFRPKRIIRQQADIEDIQTILESAGTTLEAEAKALSEVDPKVIQEMEELELYMLLALIPEGAPNYKPEYAQRAQQSSVDREGDGEK